MVELALALPVVVLLAFGVSDLGRSFSQKVDVANSAEVQARALAADPSATPSAAPGCTVSESPQPTPPYNNRITVTYSCTFAPVTPLLRNIVGTPTVASRAVVKTQW